MKQTWTVFFTDVAPGIDINCHFAVLAGNLFVCYDKAGDVLHVVNLGNVSMVSLLDSGDKQVIKGIGD